MADLDTNQARKALLDIAETLDEIKFQLHQNTPERGTHEWQAWFVLSLVVDFALMMIQRVVPMMPSEWDGHFIRNAMVTFAKDWDFASPGSAVKSEVQNWWIITAIPGRDTGWLHGGKNER